MVTLLHKHTLITAALVASLGLSACGKKSDVFNPPKEQKESVETQNKDSETQDTSGTLGGGLPDPDSNDMNPPVPEPLPQGGYPVPPPIERGDYPAVEDKRIPVREDGLVVLPNDYVTNNAANVEREGLTKRLTGAATEDGLVYTSSSTDALLDFLRARNQRVGYQSRQQNLQAAASIQSAQMAVDYFGGEAGDAIITLKIKEGKDVKVYNLQGSLQEGTATPLRVVRSGARDVTTGKRPIKGTIKCLDLDGGCENVMTRLEVGATGSMGVVYVVFRNSESDLYFQLPGKYSDNAEYLHLRDFIRNSIQQVNTSNKIYSRKFNSWEVVNGRSGFSVAIKGGNDELLGFSGPLLAPEGGTRVSIPLSRLAKDQDDSLDLISLDRAKLNFANSIGDARLIANNGLGQVKLALKMRKRGEFKQDQFAITVMRRIKPLVDITDENLK